MEIWRSSSAETIALRASWTSDRTAYGTVTRPTGRRRPARWGGRVKACDDNDVSESIDLKLNPNFLAADAETRFTRTLPGSDIAGGWGLLRSSPAAVIWLLSTYAEPHALGLAQDMFSRAALVDNDGVDTVAVRLRSLAELSGNVHSEEMMKQPLI